MAAFRNDSIFWVEVEKIVPNPYQPRRDFDAAKLQELSESIRMYGVLQPLTVSRIEVPLEDGGFKTQYELIAGERRLRASKLAGLVQVPVLIREGDESEQEKLELAIIENLQREDLNAVDRALAFRQLADVFGLSHGQVAKKVGRSREYVSNSIRLLGLPDYMLQAIKTNDITEGHARTLLMLNDRPEEQDTVYREILLKKLSVREVERITRKIATDKVRNRTWDHSDPELIEKEKEFTETLGTRVQIAKTDYGGKITIDYFSDEDLEHFLMLMKGTTSGKLSPTAVQAVEQEIAEIQQESDEALAAAADDYSDALDVITHATALESLEDEREDIVEIEQRTTVPEAEPVFTPASVIADVPQTEPAPARNSLRDRLSQLFGESRSAQPAAPSQPIQTAPTPVHNPVPPVFKEPEVVPNVVTPVVPPIVEKKVEDDDIYSLKNFSI